MESIYTELALNWSKNECDGTESVFFPYLSSAMVRFPLQSVALVKQFMRSIVEKKICYFNLFYTYILKVNYFVRSEFKLMKFCTVLCAEVAIKLDEVGPIDNRPSPK